MRYLCLVYGESPMATTGPDWDEDLRQAGNLVASCALDAGQPALTVKIRDGNIVAADAPLLQSACLLHSCIVIDARDLNDAIRISAKIPGAAVARIEIRQIVDFIAP